MAPEVLTSSSYDSKADIWSLGITLYEMATGVQPLADIPQLQAITMIPKVKPPRLPEHIGSKDMKEFIYNCLRELPNDRLSSDELARSKWIKSSSKTPVSTLEELLVRYDKWAKAGGVRQSLAQPAPWELGNDKSDEGDLSDEASSWEFDTIRHRPESVAPRERADSDPSSTSSFNSSSRAPDSLRMLFDDGTLSSSSSDPFMFRLNGQIYEQPALPSTPSTASLPDLSKTLEDDTDATARVPRFHGHARRTPQTHKQNLSVESESGLAEPARVTARYRDARSSRGIPDISIPPTEAVIVRSQDSSDTPDTSRRVPLSGQGDGTARPLRRRVSPTNFQFPRAVGDRLPYGRAQEKQTEKSPPPTGSPLPIFHHQTNPSLEYPRVPLQESVNGNVSHSAHSSVAGASDGEVLRKPPLTRQASVAVMENVLSTKATSPISKQLPPPLSRGRTTGAPLPRAEADPFAHSSRPGAALKDFLKLSPLPPAIFGPDMLPPSPSVQSPPIRMFAPASSSLGNGSILPQSGPSISSSSSGASEDLKSVDLPSSTMNPFSAYSLSRPLRPLDFHALLQSREETHAELGRTVEELTQWLQIIDHGLSTLLAHIDTGDEASEDAGDVTTKPIPLSPLRSTPSPKPG